MFVGHYSVAFAAKTKRNKIPLWVLFIAVQFLDYIWATLVLLGIEKLRVIKGFTAGSMLDSYFHPYSHSLIAALVWSVIVALIYKSDNHRPHERGDRSEEHTSELQSHSDLVCRLLLEKKKQKVTPMVPESEWETHY